MLSSNAKKYLKINVLIWNFPRKKASQKCTLKAHTKRNIQDFTSTFYKCHIKITTIRKFKNAKNGNTFLQQKRANWWKIVA